MPRGRRCRKSKKGVEHTPGARRDSGAELSYFVRLMSVVPMRMEIKRAPEITCISSSALCPNCGIDIRFPELLYLVAPEAGTGVGTPVPSPGPCGFGLSSFGLVPEP